MTEKSRAVNESEIVESVELTSWNPKRQVKTTMMKKKILTALSMLIHAVIPIMMFIKIFDKYMILILD